MNAKQTYKYLTTDYKFKGLEIQVDTRRKQIDVYRFDKTANPHLCKNALEEIGFECAPNFGSKNWRNTTESKSIKERVEAMTPEQQAHAKAVFDEMVTGR